MRNVKRMLAAASAVVVLALALGVLTGTSTSAVAPTPVKVINTTAEPVPVNGAVRVHNNTANPLTVDIANPVGAQCFANFSGEVAECTIANIPEGQILTIEQITCGLSVAAGSRIGSLNLAVPSAKVPPAAGLENMNHTLVLTKMFSVLDGFPSLDYYGLTQQVRLYAFGPVAGTGDSTILAVKAQTGDSIDTGQLNCAISGHMGPQ